jgi:Flp pilus assembly protein TadD
MMRLTTLLAAVLTAGPPALAAAQPTAPARVLVVPFENAQREARLGWLGEAAAVLLAEELNARGVPAIMRVERVRAFEQLHLPLTAALTRATVIKVGHIVGASEVIVGSFKVDGTDLIVEAHSIRIETGRLQPHVSERAPLTGLFGIFDALARRLASGTKRTAPAVPQPSPGAFENYIKGLLAESAATRATFLETAIRDHPGFDRAKLALWDVRHEQGDHAAALAVARQVPADSPLSARARLRLGVSLLELQQHDEAFAAFTALLDDLTRRRSDLLAPVLNNLGVLVIRRGASPLTASPAYYLTKATDADPGDPDYQFNLGYAYALDGNHQGALYWLREALRRSPEDADAHYVLAAALQASGSTVEAAREKELAMQLSSRYEELEGAANVDRPAVPRGLERLRLELERPSTLRPEQSLSRGAQREQRDLAAFHLESGRRLFEREQNREAMAELRRAVYLSPYDAQAHLLIGRIHLRAGRPREAIDALKISIWSEETAAARLALAEAYLAAKEGASARTELERALVLDPQLEEAKRLLDSLKVDPIK